ncbi:WD repeat-containing protein 82-like [Oppia nitens]|uniref:WD repeat-containing protein 82-like n=1 Tax=Oppia nitens TaxID=1686743 RepID=UPI0023DA9D40|nr:WD repeat-containing protein 82-like [Oppia nitens]
MIQYGIQSNLLANSLVGVQPIDMKTSSQMDERLLTDFHQIRYTRFQKNDDSSYKVNSMDWNQSGTHLMVSSDDSIVRIFNLNGDEVGVIPSKKHGSDHIHWMNDTNTCVFASRYETQIGADVHKIRHLDINSKTFLHYYCGHERQVTGISINKNYNCFLSSSLDNTIRLWDSRLNANIKPGDRRSLSVVKCLSRSVASFDPTGLVFAVSLQTDSSLRLYDIRNYTKGPFKVNRLESDQSLGDVYGLYFSPNGKMIALSTNGISIRIVDAYSLQERCKLNGFKNELRKDLELTWTPDSQYIFCGSSGNFAGIGTGVQCTKRSLESLNLIQCFI